MPSDASGQDFTLMPVDGQEFAANMPVTMCPPNVKPTGGNSEIGYLTAVDGDALTTLRAQEVSIPMQVEANWQIFGSVTAKSLADIEQAVLAIPDPADSPISAATQVALNTKVDADSLAPVATSGSYNDLQNKPFLGTAASTKASDYATAAGRR